MAVKPRLPIHAEILGGIEILPQLLAGDRNPDPRSATRADKRGAGKLFIGEPLRDAAGRHTNKSSKIFFGNHVVHQLNIVSKV
jgi:hypothetical protein